MTPWPNRLLRLEYLFRKNIAYVIEQPANSLLPLYKPLQEREGEREREREREGERERERERKREREPSNCVLQPLVCCVMALLLGDIV